MRDGSFVNANTAVAQRSASCLAMSIDAGAMLSRTDTHGMPRRCISAARIDGQVPPAWPVPNDTDSIGPRVARQLASSADVLLLLEVAAAVLFDALADFGSDGGTLTGAGDDKDGE